MSDTAQPRLFLARDRVRRLPPVHDWPEQLAGASLPDEAKPSTPPGPVLLNPENGLSTAIAPSPAAPTLPAIGLARRTVLSPPEVQLTDAMPECPRLDDPVRMESPAHALPARAMPLLPTVGPREPFLSERGPVSPKTPEPPANEAGDGPGPQEAAPAKAVVERSEQREQIAREADRHTRRGFELAGRNAVFAARSQFIVALRLLAQGLDADHGGGRHSRALAEGLDAIQEADVFIPRGARIEADLDLAVIIRGHRTPVLKQTDLNGLTPMLALKAYFTYAQERLAAAVAGEVAGSMALHGLGKLHASIARNPAIDLAAAEPKAVTFFQAALLVYPRNLMAANDLGVLLARAGNWQGARQVFEHAVAVNPQSVSWRNLATVYQQLGDPPMAMRARQMADAVTRQEMARRGGRQDSDKVQWLAPNEFAGTHVDSRVSPAPRTGQFPLGDLRFNKTMTAPVHARSPKGRTVPPEQRHEVMLCQALGPAASRNVCAVDCAAGCCGNRWERLRAFQWEQYAQGEYAGPARLPHVPEYRLRVDDELDLVYRLTREEMSGPYRLEVGDEIRVESFTDPELNRDLLIQPDGTITLRLLGQVKAAQKSVADLTGDLEELYKKYYKVPSITVTPLRVNTRLEDLRATVDARYGRGGLQRLARVTPSGDIALPVLGSVFVQGLTLSELGQELNERYREHIAGIEVIPVLVARAPRYVYVLGEVATPGRFELTGPTTLMQALAMAGSWNVGANLQQIVVFRRGDDWRLLATMVDVNAALFGRDPCPAGEIWLSDSDVIVVPKGAILQTTDFIDLVFTRGIYGVFPLNASVNFAKLSTL
jgi:polysaccharide export outer membrane protein